MPPTKRRKWLELDMHPVVFPASAGLIVLFVIVSAVWPDRAMLAFSDIQSAIVSNFAWLYIAAMTAFVVFLLWLGGSRYGKIRLGREGEEPEFSTITWFAMLFSAGMGIGMLFFGVAEPLTHYLHPPAGSAEGAEAARQAMGLTLFHWCLHPWALYALVALALAYFGFRRGLPLSFRSVFYPLLGERIHGVTGHVIDVLAVCATLFGLATSLGLGAKQVNAGLSYVFGLQQGTGIQVIIIACITSMAVVSLVTGLHAGIRRLSELNMVLAGLLLLFLFVAGPTLFLLGGVVENAGVYLTSLPEKSFWTATYEGGEISGWFGNWTVFYWGWWIAWSPFVGMFIARVSRGRTVRQFVTGVLLVPTAVSIVWMTGFGTSALHQEVYQEVAEAPGEVRRRFDYEAKAVCVQVRDDTHGLPRVAGSQWLVADGALVKDDGKGGLVARDGTRVEMKAGVLVRRSTSTPFEATGDTRFRGTYEAQTERLTLGGYLTAPVLNEAHTVEQDTTATVMFRMLEAYPLPWLTAILATLSVILFFVTSSDSASMVADIIASGGNQNPPVGTRLFWGILEGVLAAVLLTAGGLEALQTGSIAIGLPFCIIIIVMCYSLITGLRQELSGALPAEQLAHVRGEDGEEPDGDRGAAS